MKNFGKFFMGFFCSFGIFMSGLVIAFVCKGPSAVLSRPSVMLLALLSLMITKMLENWRES